MGSDCQARLRLCGTEALPSPKQPSPCLLPVGGADLWIMTLLSSQAGNRAACAGAVAGGRNTRLIHMVGYE